MITVQQTDVFEKWLEGVGDPKAQLAITNRILRIEGGLFGDTKSLGDKVGEIKIDYGPGYRLYYTRLDLVVIILLCGGAKGTQKRDLKLAKSLVTQI